MLTFAVTLTRIGRTRYHSTILVRRGATRVALVAMESTFIRRSMAGHNRGVARSMVARPCRLLPSTPPVRPDGSGAAALIPGNRASIVLSPSPHEDFNFAGFLYFAAFQAMFDRAEWQWFRPLDPLLQSSFRHIRYLGNIEPGENVRAELIGYRQDETGLAQSVSLRRATDDFEIARSFCKREPPSHRTFGDIE